MASDTSAPEATDAIVPSPGNYGVQMVPAEAESTVAFEDPRPFNSGYGVFANYIHPKGGVVTLSADVFARRLYQNKGFIFLGYCASPAEVPINEAPAYLGPKAEPITEEQIAAAEEKIKQKLAEHGITDEAQVKKVVEASTSRLRPKPVPQGQTLPGMLALEGYNRGVAGLDPSMNAPQQGAPSESRAVPGGYVMNVPAAVPPEGENGNGEPIEESAPALPKSTRASKSSGSASTPAAGEPSAPAGS